MQDRFKFRAWNKLSNELKDIKSLNINHSFPACSNVIVETNSFDKIKTHNMPIECSVGLNNIILMQCTGLKDKNGKQVYFDDLVRLPDGVIGKVAQIRDIDNIDYGRVVILPVANILNKVYQRVYVPTMIKYSEIIGNVYENPELLEEKQC